ncbi:MAG TPA: hypothetical protein VKA43_13810 [Gammaproteobacteria bacterium]|nr:hypothetical protein [Gammaproteobacteria bacterium]
MQRRTWIVGVTVLILSLAHSARAQSNGAWDVVLNGRAVHVNAAREWNEENWGIGFEREFATASPWVKVALANGFKDSMGKPSYMAGGGIKRRFQLRSDFYVDVGGIAFLMTRENVNRSEPFPGVLPAATFGFKRVAVNLTYLPESVADRVTSSRRHDPSMQGVFFLQLKLDASLFGFGGRRRELFAESAAR